MGGGGGRGLFRSEFVLLLIGEVAGWGTKDEEKSEKDTV